MQRSRHVRIFKRADFIQVNNHEKVNVRLPIQTVELGRGAE
jgi:hypothetical protein